jgi:Zinc-uptake complex component A periplasmic
MSTALTMAVPMTATASPSTSKDEVKLDRADADHGPAETDMHIWLDPEKAVLAAEIAPALAAADPSNAAVYQANPDSLRQRLDELDRSLGRPNRAEGLPPAGFSSIEMDRPAKSLASGAASVRHWSQAAPIGLRPLSAGSSLISICNRVQGLLIANLGITSSRPEIDRFVNFSPKLLTATIKG